MSDPSSIGLWATLTCHDTEAMITWLQAVGFTEHAVHRDDDQTVSHVAMVWPAGGGVMFGPYRENPVWPQRPGQGAAYLVTEDPDGVHRGAVAAGGTSLMEVETHDYGGRGGTVRDPEGNLWSFGDYRPR
jgi:uncharacterized glyoxalase superfamily protein PhnB